MVLLSFALAVRKRGAPGLFHCQSPQHSSLSQGFRLLVSPTGFVTSIQTLILSSLRPPSVAKRHPKFSHLLSRSSAWSASTEASRLVDTDLSFSSNLSSSSNFLTEASASRWASAATKWPAVPASPLAAAARFPSRPQRAMCSSSNERVTPAGVFRAPHIHAEVRKHLTYRTPLPTPK